MVSFGQREVILIKYRSNFTYDKKELSLLPYKNLWIFLTHWNSYNIKQVLDSIENWTRLTSSSCVGEEKPLRANSSPEKHLGYYLC